MNSGPHIADKRISAIADAIDDLFKNGILLSGDVLSFLESTYGISGPEELSAALAPPFDCESESICEMLFYPDEAQQKRLEPILEENPIKNEREKNDLADAFSARSVVPALYFPGIDRPVTVDIPDSVRRRFINRLGTNRRMDSRIKRAINENIQTPGTATTLKVKLRNTRFAFDDNKVSSICHFLVDVDENDPAFMPLFILLCRILETMAPDKDLYTALMETKYQCMEMLRQAEKNKTDLEKEPVEALMMKGATIAAVNVEAVRVTIDQVDQMALKLFGKTENIPSGGPPQPPAINLGVYKTDETGIDGIIKILS